MTVVVILGACWLVVFIAVLGCLLCDGEQASVDMERARRQAVEAKLRDARRELDSLKHAHLYVLRQNARLTHENEALRASR